MITWQGRQIEDCGSTQCQTHSWREKPVNPTGSAARFPFLCLASITVSEVKHATGGVGVLGRGGGGAREGGWGGQLQTALEETFFCGPANRYRRRERRRENESSVAAVMSQLRIADFKDVTKWEGNKGKTHRSPVITERHHLKSVFEARRKKFVKFISGKRRFRHSCDFLIRRQSDTQGQ